MFNPFEFLFDLFARLTNNYELFVEANRRLADFLKSLGINVAGGLWNIIVFIVSGVFYIGAFLVTAWLVLFGTFFAAGIEERIWKTLWGVKGNWFVKTIVRAIALFQFVIFYMIVIGIQVAALGIFLPGLMVGDLIWFLIAGVLVMNVLIMRWQFRHDRMFPRWLNPFNRYMEARRIRKAAQAEEKSRLERLAIEEADRKAHTTTIGRDNTHLFPEPVAKNASADLPLGTSVYVVKIDGDWAEVKAGEKHGYVRVKNLAILPDAFVAPTFAVPAAA